MKMCDLTLWPYGNARETKTNEGWEFSCQHGAEECVGNMIEACGLNFVEDQTQKARFVVCMEQYASKDGSKVSFPKYIDDCASQAGSADMAPEIKDCYQGPQGVALVHAIAVQTATTNHKYVPFIMTNGKHDTAAEDAIDNSLLDYVCSHYKGPNRSPNCPSETELFVSNTKNLFFQAFGLEQSEKCFK